MVLVSDMLEKERENSKAMHELLMHEIVSKTQIYEAWENLCVEHKEICGELDRRDKKIAALNEELEELRSKGFAVTQANFKAFRF